MSIMTQGYHSIQNQRKAEIEHCRANVSSTCTSDCKLKTAQTKHVKDYLLMILYYRAAIFTDIRIS